MQAHPVGQSTAVQPPSTPPSRKRRALIIGVVGVAVALLICIGGIAVFRLLTGGNSSTAPSSSGSTTASTVTDAVDLIDYMGKDFEESTGVIDAMPGSGPINMGDERWYEIHNGQGSVVWDLRVFKDPDGKVYWITGEDRYSSEIDEATPRLCMAGIRIGQDYEEARSTLENSGWKVYEEHDYGVDYMNDEYILRIKGKTIVTSFNIRALS